MGRFPLLTVIVLLLGVVMLVNGSSEAAKAKSEIGSVTYLDVLRRITNLRGEDIRKNLRSLRQLAIQHGLIKRSDVYEPTARVSNEEQSSEGEESSLESEPGQDDTAIAEGRKKGGGGGSNNNIVVAGGGGGHDDGSYSISIEEGGHKKGKKGKKGKKHRKHKRKGWKKHMKKAVPIGMGILALKALLLHFILKKLVMATALSLLLSKKSLLVSSLIALKLLLQQPHSNDKSESSKLEVVHIPIRKEAGFHKKHQQQQVPSGKMKLPSIGTSPPSTTKAPSSSLSLFDPYVGSTPHQIQHTHQQMADFGGKYIPLGYETNHFHFDATPSGPTFGDSGLNSVQNVEQFFDDADELQFDRQDNGWDGWSGWNRGERYEQSGPSALASGVVAGGSGGGSSDTGSYIGWGGTEYGVAAPEQQQPTSSGYGSLNRSQYGEVFDGYRHTVQANNPPRLHQLIGRRKRKF
ncbi:uncharacterized protein LOC125761208 isoform X2 [Anopheles funestus]|uniref:Uncharacterized protein n=1 Tax=Anopheles funestus TaxID=62324 RepID=A0A182R850_ANOFN|nr:uncharacterized protein LOC125761208 isoform X2 [Anopheles funestus]